jgi:predicted Zn finger-like uncharacterized protein
MIITCEKCYAKFNLDENLLKQTGSKVRCSKCQNIFLAYPPIEMERVAEPAEEVVGSETVSSDVKAESVEQLEVSEEPEAALEIEEEDLDLFDLNLEEEMEPESKAEKEPEEFPELELDTEPVAEKTPEESEAVLEIEEEDLDLFDIEKMVDTEEEPKLEAETKEEPEELELELDTEPVTEKTLKEEEEALETGEDKIELSSLNLKEEPEPEAEAKEKPEEPELEFELEKPLEAGVETEEASITTEQETTPGKKKRISAPVLIVLIIALLTGGAYSAYVALKSMNINIPFISDLVEPAVQDEAGNLKIIAFDIADKFIDNSKVGKLFIISGKVKNEYSGARSFIRVTGKLYAKERVLSKTATVCCGNVLSDQDLSNMDMNSINKRLLNPLGDNKSNVNVKPGKLLPFMIVFPNIPDNITEYTVEVMGSSPA